MSYILDIILNKELDGLKVVTDFAELVENPVNHVNYEAIEIDGRSINFAYTTNTGEIACATKFNNEDWIMFSGEADFKTVIEFNPEYYKIIEFLLFHETGHIMFDHFEIVKNETEHIIHANIEAQADAYAVYRLGLSIEDYMKLQNKYSFPYSEETIEIVRKEVGKLKETK